MANDLHSKLTNGVKKILGPKGLITHAGMTHSPIQFQYAIQVAEGFAREEDPADNRCRINLLEAQTGTGKTLGYLVPLMLFSAYTGERVMVSTYTRALQKQILEKDASLACEWVGKVTGKHLTMARRIGRRNYLSPSRCKALLDELDRSNDKRYDEAIGFLEDLIEWMQPNDRRDDEQLPAPILDDYLAAQGINELPFGVVRSMIDLEPSSPDEEQFSYLRDVLESKAADLVVVNHTLLLMHAYRWMQLLDDHDEGFRKANLVVVDEADRIPDAASSVIGADLTLHNLVSLSNEVGKSIPATLNAATSMEALHAEVMALHRPGLSTLAILSKDTQGQKLSERVSHANNAARKCAAPLREWMEKELASDVHTRIPLTAKVAKLLDAYNDLQEFNAAMHSHDNTALVSWSPIREYPSLRIGKPWPGRLLSRLWREPTDDQVAQAELISTEPESTSLYAILFTSATLSVPGKSLPAAFDDFALSVGVSRFSLKGDSTPLHRVQVDLYRRFEPTQFGELSFVLPDPRIPNPTMKEDDFENDRRWSTNPEWLDYTTQMTLKAWGSGDRVLVLTLSHSDTQALAERLKQTEAAEFLVVQNAGESLSGLRSRFIDLDRAVLITASGWEGLDMPGLVKNLVITRIPFAPPGNAESEILRAHLFAKGISPDRIDAILRAQMMNAARRKMAQGIGRAIRSKTDTSTVWIADPRFPLPDSISGSIDPIVLDAPRRNIQHLMLECIPARFRDEAFDQAQLLLTDGALCRPT